MPTKRYPILADIKHCTGCLGCVDVCPHGALSRNINEEGHYTYKLDSEKCIGCLQCERVCPAIGDKSYGDNSLENPVYAAWTTDGELRKRSASGGVAAALSIYFVEKGGEVIGAAMDGFECKHVVVDSLEGLTKLQGSKYMQSDTTGVYRKMLSSLKDGKMVLFTGTPCQVAAAINYIKDDRLQNNLYTLDMACGGVPSLFLRDRFKEEFESDVKGIDSFRNKDKGWRSTNFAYELRAISKDDKIKSYGLHNLFLGAFGMGLTNRYSCYDCKFAKVNRKSDFTVADFWGDHDFSDQHHEGLSSLSVHTEKGKRLLENLSTIDKKETEWSKVLLHNYRYAYGKSILGHSLVRKHLAKSFRNYSYEKLCKLYAAATTKNVFYFALMAFNIIRGKINRKNGIKYILRNILNTSK